MKKEIHIEAIKAALVASWPEHKGYCVTCQGPKDDKGRSPVIEVLQHFLTEDEYLMMGILLRRRRTVSSSGVKLPVYRKSTKFSDSYGSDGCFTLDCLIERLDAVVYRPET